jgi:hypothetical protein
MAYEAWNPDPSGPWDRTPSIYADNFGGTGGSGVTGGFETEFSMGVPPLDGSATKQGWKDQITGRKWVNLFWPDIANPVWEEF